MSGESSLNRALRAFEAAEANLEKLERLWKRIRELIPESIEFSPAEAPEYEECCFSFRRVLEELPAIDGWKAEDRLMELNEIAECRLDVMLYAEEPWHSIYTEQHIDSQEGQLRHYRQLLTVKRRELARQQADALVAEFDTRIEAIESSEGSPPEEDWSALADALYQLGALLGSHVRRPHHWEHLRDGVMRAAEDPEARPGMAPSILYDWTLVKSELPDLLRPDEDPVPVDAEDLGELVASRPEGPIATSLRWEALSDEDFERLLFCLISDSPGYQNPQWLMKTNAPDRGRDLSVDRVRTDPLGGTERLRVLIQCKHWTTKSLGPGDIQDAQARLKLWEPPRVDVLVIATSGRFTADAVALVEKLNQEDRALRIEAWNDAHLERLLTQRPALVGEFGLR